MKNKRVLTLIILISLFSNVFSQNKDEISGSIEKLAIKGTRQEAISFLIKQNRDDSSKLKPVSTELHAAINRILKDSGFDYAIANLALELCQSGLIVLDKGSEKVLIQEHQSIKKKLKQEANYHNWIWNDEIYMDNRDNSGLILDLLGYGATEESKNELKNSIVFFKDARLKYFALISAERRNLETVSIDIEYLASDDETRGLIYRHLQNSGRLHAFPKKYNTQEELSKADMVNWLIFPTELGRVPDKIELVKIVTLVFDDVGPADFYLWKFMSADENWKGEGWMIGLSGAFVRSESPTIDSHGFTFSAFTKLEEKTPDEHFEQIMGIMEDWNQNN